MAPSISDESSQNVGQSEGEDRGSPKEKAATHSKHHHAHWGPGKLFRLYHTISGPRRAIKVLQQVVRRRDTWRADRRAHLYLYSVPEGAMPVTTVPALRQSRDASLGRRAAVGPLGGELVLKNLAEQLLANDELWIFKQSLQHFRVTRSVPSLCTALRPLITNTERLMLLVELAQHLPSEPLKRDFHKLCTLHFPKYHTFLRYFSPQQVTDGSKVIAQDASGQLQVVNKGFGKSIFGSQTNGSLRIPTTTVDATSVHAESGFYSEMDDTSRHGNGRNSMSSRAGTSPPDSAPSTLHRPRSTLLATSLSGHVSQSNRSSSAKSLLGTGPVMILSGSFQSLNNKPPNLDMHSSGESERDGESEGGSRHRRILLARRSDGSLGVGIKGGKEYGTPIVVCVVDEDSQAQQQGLRVGDRIVDVNGTDFRHVTHAEAVTLMRNAWNIIMTVEIPGHDASSQANTGTVQNGGSERHGDGSPLTMELDVHVYPSSSGKLGCAVNRDSDNGDITVKSVETNSAASKAGMWLGDTILQIDGMNVSSLTEKQITTLTNSKRVRLRLRRTLDRPATAELDVPDSHRPRKDTTISDDAFSPLDFSSPVLDDDMFTFAASIPRNPTGRSRSEDRHLSTAHATATSPPPDMRRAETVADVHRQADNQTEIFQRIYIPRSQTPGWAQPQPHTAPPPHTGRSVSSSGGGGSGGGGWGTVMRGRATVRQHPPSSQHHHHHHNHNHQSPRYTLVYSVRGRSKETIIHPEVTHRSPHGASASAAAAASQSRSSKMRYIRNRSRSRESGTHHTLSPADRDLLQAVQSGVEKRQRALRLSMYQVPDDGDTEWKM